MENIISKYRYGRIQRHNFLRFFINVHFVHINIAIIWQQRVIAKEFVIESH